MPVVKKAVDSAQRLTRYSRWVWNKYPEQFVGYLFFGVIGFGAFINLVVRYPDLGYYGAAPFYRNHYECRRPDDAVAMNWRLPEEYPAYYVTKRESEYTIPFIQDYVHDWVKRSKYD